MTAPAPSPDEQAVIERFGIFDEERVVEEVARAIEREMAARCETCLRPEATEEDWARYDEGQGDHLCWEGGDCRIDADLSRTRLAAAAAVAAYRATQDGGAEEEVRRVLADLVEAVGRGDEVGLPEAYRAARAALAPQAGDGAR